MTFKKTKFKVIKEAIPRKVADFIYRYFLKKRQVAAFYLIPNTFLHLHKSGEYGMIQ